MDDLNFDSLLTQYNNAIDRWIEAIRKEESLATPEPFHGSYGKVG